MENLSIDEYKEKIENCLKYIKEDLENVGKADAGRKRGLHHFQEIMDSHQKWLGEGDNYKKWEESERKETKSMQDLFDEMKVNAETLLLKSEYATPKAYKKVKKIIIDTYNYFVKLDEDIIQGEEVKEALRNINVLMPKIKKDSVELPKILERKKSKDKSNELLKQAKNWQKNLKKHFNAKTINQEINYEDWNTKTKPSVTFPQHPMMEIVPAEPWGNLVDFLNSFNTLVCDYASKKI